MLFLNFRGVFRGLIRGKLYFQSCLRQSQIELSEFFCEDPNAFKMEDCYKSLANFCAKFKTAVTENCKRKEQEILAEQRRALREAEEMKKAKSGKNFLEISEGL